jgi:hypothetical protein
MSATVAARATRRGVGGRVWAALLGGWAIKPPLGRGVQIPREGIVTAS